MVHESNETYKLTEEDYENIWLRNKEKMRNLAFFWAGALAVLVALGAWVIVEKMSSDAINSYIGTESFRESVLNKLTSQLEDLNERLDYADAVIRGIEIDAQRLDNIGFTVFEHGFTLADPQGEIVHFEYGMGKTGLSEIEFKMPFNETPLLLIFVDGYRTRSAGAYIGEIDSKKASLIIDGGRTFGTTVHYIAVGR